VPALLLFFGFFVKPTPALFELLPLYPYFSAALYLAISAA